MTSAPTCSFCCRRSGESSLDQVKRHYESGEVVVDGQVIDGKEILDRLAAFPDRKVRILMPGPDDIRICDVCVEQYSSAMWS